MDRFMYRYRQTVYQNLCQIWFTTDACPNYFDIGFHHMQTCIFSKIFMNCCKLFQPANFAHIVLVICRK